MGFRDTDSPNPLEFFMSTGEPIAWSNERLRQRLQLGQGQSLYRADQVDAVYDALDEEPSVQLEYDRFMPEFVWRAG